MKSILPLLVMAHDLQGQTVVSRLACIAFGEFARAVCDRQRERPVEIWDCTMPFGKPQTDVVIAPQYQIEKHRVDFAIFINGVANEE